MNIAFLLVSGFTVALAAVIPQKTPVLKCGYEGCPPTDPKKLNVHLVAHTHDDVGWLKTVDQYYFGSRPRTQLAGVQYIIESVIDALEKDPSRKFIYVETAFLWKWWLRAEPNRRDIVKNLIEQGRLEIIGGGWSMNDEAVTHYHSIIDQFTWGFRRLNDTFGRCARPRIGWQIDPFGHSREQASIFAQMGFDGMFFGRLDYQDKLKRMLDKEAELVWQGSPSLGKSADLFTVVLYNTYSPPPGFCFDVLCRDEAIVDDPDSFDYNIDKRAVALETYVMKQSESYRTNNVLLTMGEDFNYQNAEMWFTNLDKLIKFMNNKNESNINIFYSTPSCFLKSVNEHKDVNWVKKEDDFFPYASDQHTYWTGYFSSRPTVKYFERLGNNYLQVVKQMSVKSRMNPKCKKLANFRETMGVMQHHDAVTGTEQQHVAEDYARLLHRSFEFGDHIANDALNKWLPKEETGKKVKFESCLLLNISSCEATSNNKQFALTLYNPTSQALKTFVRVPVQGTNYTVLNHEGKSLVYQIVPIPESLQNIPGRVDLATHELVFQAENLPPLGYQSYHVTEQSREKIEHKNENDNFIQSKMYNISVNSDNDIDVRGLSGSTEFVQSFYYYTSQEGNNEEASNRSSGAYILRPKQESPEKFAAEKKVKIFKGPVVEEIHQVVNQWVSQVIRVYPAQDYVEFNWLVGPIPIEDKIGKEVITKYKSNLKNKEEFYTDSNGREMLKRKLNYRPTWPLVIKEKVAGNYYPITTKITIEDDEAKLRLSALIDRAQGGSSLQEGELELMLHRRILHDDAFGVGEALNETAYGQGLVARGRHYLVAGDIKDSRDAQVLLEKELATELALQPWTFVTALENTSFEEWSKQYKMRGLGLHTEIPKSVRILTLEPWNDNQVLLRLEHLFEVNETSEYSVPAKVDLKTMFVGMEIESVRETTLGGNEWKEENQRMSWGPENNNISRASDDKSGNIEVSADAFVAILKPMEIKTFIVSVKYL